jgi:hypothetical protein
MKRIFKEITLKSVYDYLSFSSSKPRPSSVEIVETCLLVVQQIVRQGNMLLDKGNDQEINTIFERQQPNTQATAPGQTNTSQKVIKPEKLDFLTF